MGDPVRVSVVATDPVLEAGTRSALAASPEVSLSPCTAPEVAGDARVAVVVADQVAPSVLDLVREIRDTPPRPEVVLVVADLTPAEALHAVASGVRGVLRRREASGARLAHTVLAVAGGDCTVPIDLLGELLGTGCEPPAAATAWSANGLSERERAVLRLVADGMETGEIARELCYSTRTVTTVVHDITHRFRLRNRAHAVAYALRAGLL
ncbi:DNA-binding response regulator, NarL/FixJ family, contains REC and HTH domains [Streptomyces zhaozhouensis]|uniref:DNA-binding response regulator, NarL/FixJ family, contains REC and HTH domains n=1 Tax=Streptomyces zhaozhouensis TaxID=1300267 RepID=A0A286DZT4_9ACTN|nr:response regulator transcription factor [Streptomyces zhaozhouensis]SOD64133.1 DNA-binding response regulator, NarL/FixJ family, contains REC and HTH domains [Streptomyces zhaozhouensis]